MIMIGDGFPRFPVFQPAKVIPSPFRGRENQLGILIFSSSNPNLNQVLQYLEQYAEAHLLHKYIQFSTQVFTTRQMDVDK